MSKRTKGPWSLRDDFSSWAVIGPEPSWITEIQKDSHNAFGNARLIAAAPDLLEALKIAQQYVDVEGSEEESDLVRAAIAKAEGMP